VTLDDGDLDAAVEDGLIDRDPRVSQATSSTLFLP
jgi:hypothetical protein